MTSPRQETHPSLRFALGPFARRHAGLLGTVAVGGLLGNFLQLSLPLFGSFVYDKVLGNGVTETLWAVAIGVALALVLDLCGKMLRMLSLERLAVETEEGIDRSLFRAVLSRTGTAPAVGVLLDKYKQSLAGRDFVSSVYLMAATDVPFVFLFLGAIALVSGPLVLVPLGCGTLALLINLALHRIAEDSERTARRAGEQRFTLLADISTAREIVATGPLRPEMEHRWTHAGSEAARAMGRTRYWYGLSSAITLILSNLGYIGVLIGGAYLVEERALTSGGLLAASMLSMRALSINGSILLLATRFKEFRRALKELDALFPTVVAEAADRPRDPEARLHITALTYRPRPEGAPVFEKISLAVGYGEIIGIAGLPGAGKTSLFRMIAGVEKPQEGEILLDHIPVGQWSASQLGRTIGYKTQEPLLFQGTIEDNILAGRRHTSPETLHRALDRSGLRFSIERGELSLGTEIGPRGAFLSGGQRQMVALARALLGEPPLLLLDEPTAGLDAQSESRFAATLAAFKGQRTVLVATHSRPLLLNCTRIIVLHQGRIGADGPAASVLSA